MKKKLLIVTGIYPPDIGGPASYLPQVVDYMLKRNVSVKVFTYGANDNFSSQTRMCINRDKNLFVRELQAFILLLYLAKDVDCIFTNGNYFKSFLISKIFRKKNILKIVGDPAWERARNWNITHTVVDNFRNDNQIIVKLFKILRNVPVKYASYIVTPSYYLNNMVKSWTANNKVKTIYNGVNISKNKNNSLINHKADEPRLLVISRLVKWKNIDSIIKILNFNNGYLLDIVGDGPEMLYLQSVVNDLKLNDRVFFHGNITDNKIIKNFYKNAFCLILNSDYEGLSHVILEAMINYCPVICSSIDGNIEIIDHGINGLLFETNNIKHMLENIIKLHDQNLRNRMINAAHQKIISRFDLEKNMSLLYDLLLKSK